MNDDEQARILHEQAQAVRERLSGYDIGLSSKALLHCIAFGNRNQKNHPLDPDDFGRCHRALQALPFLRERLELARSLSPTWNLYVTYWAVLEQSFDEEETFGEAPRTNAMMQLIQRCAREGRDVDAVEMRDAIENTRKAVQQPKRTFYVVSDDEREHMTGKTIGFVAGYMKLLTKNYGTRCRDCSKKRDVLLLGRFGPSPDPLRCDDCGRARLAQAHA